MTGVRSSLACGSALASILACLHASSAFAQARPGPGPNSAAVARRAPAEQTTIGEVVVTARRVEENLQKVPVAVTAIGADQITRDAVIDPTHVQFVAPSVQAYTTYNRLVGGYSVRGIAGAGSYFAEAPGGPTSVPSVPFYDMGSIQVLNGPQGTLFGRTNISGAALFEPVRPHLNGFDGFADVSVGGLGLNRDAVALNIPIIDDHLAVRVAAERYHLDGFTKVIGSDTALNETNNWSARVGVLWKPGDGRFTDYAVFNYLHADESSSGWVLSAYNPNIAEFHLPANINAPGGLAAGTAYFGGPCATAVAAGIQSSFNGCIDQRLRLSATWLPALQAELARIDAGGNGAVRYTGGPADAGLPLHEFLNQFFFVNQASYDFGKLGFTTLTLKNIFSVNSANGSSGWQIDGIGGSLFSALSGGGGNFFFSNAGNQTSHLDAPATGYFTDSPYVTTFTDEMQVRGVIGHDLLSWNVGGFFSDLPLPVNTTGIQNIARIFGGTFQPTLGFQPSFFFQNGGDIKEEAVFSQGTLNLGWFGHYVGLKGLHFTAGFRDTWDQTDEHFLDHKENITTGLYYPGGMVPSAKTSSSGINTTFALDAQVTDNLLIYGTTRTAYVPGGVNTVVGASSVFPNYVPTYAPETVTDYEAGVKTDFHLGPVAARLDADVYRLDFADIQELLFASGGGITATFTVNAAGARMQGAELQAQAILGPFQGQLTYAYTDAKFTHWQASDPLGLIGPGSPQCLPSSPPGECLLDLKGSAFPNIPQQKVSASLTYTLPVRQELGVLSFTASGSYQTRQFFSVQGTRNIQAFGPVIGYREVENSQSQGPYGIVNLRFDWKNIRGSRISAAAFVNNLADYNYAISSVSVLQSLGTAVNLYGDPRTFGVQLRYEFGR